MNRTLLRRGAFLLQVCLNDIHPSALLPTTITEGLYGVHNHAPVSAAINFV